jgi:tRNA nucleotidyltransferase (CCA-adding enzyme)
MNLSEQIKKQLPLELVEFLQEAGSISDRLGSKTYLVGGAVRDLLLNRVNLDLDLVVEGDASKMAEELARIKNGKVIAHSRFNTAKIKWGRWVVDIASARSEGYPRPGALPSVKPSEIKSDLIRRDFSINAMAIYLEPAKFGELIDLYGGRRDLEQSSIRVLHDDSFKDDATRIWRAVRYEQRLGFKIDPHTLDLIKENLYYLDTISGDRIRHELELCLEEERPEKILLRADQLGLLAKINPSLAADEVMKKVFIKARGILQPFSPPEDLYFVFLMRNLNPEELNKVIAYLKLTRPVTLTLLDSLSLKNDLKMLGEPDIPPSWIYRYLSPYSLNAIIANLIYCDNHLIQQRMELFINKLRHVQPALSGEDLIEAGVPSGPRIKRILDTLREARLDGKVTTIIEEREIVSKMTSPKSQTMSI